MPVKISDDLVKIAREEAAIADRSITAQIEHWAKLGRTVEKVLRHDEAAALKTSGGHLEIAFPDGPTRERIAALLHEISLGSGRRELAQELIANGPVYQSDPAGSGAIERIEPDGRRTLGRLENRRFVPIETPKRSRG